MSIKVLKTLNSVESRNFDDIEEFNQYYTLHKEEIDKMTTNAINKYYKIPGMHLVKRKGELKALAITETVNPLDTLRTTVEEQAEEIRVMKVTIKKMIKEINILKGVDFTNI